MQLFRHVRSETEEGVLRVERDIGRMENALQATYK